MEEVIIPEPEPVRPGEVVAGPAPRPSKEERKRLKKEEKKKQKLNPMLEALHKEQTKYRNESNTKVPKKGKKREDMTMRLLTGFTSKMKENVQEQNKREKEAAAAAAAAAAQTVQDEELQ